jgi:hypothetical protein
MEAKKFCGMTIDWNYEAGHVTISMPGYIQKALNRFNHLAPPRPQNAPYPWTVPDFGARIQYAEPEDQSVKLDKAGIKRIMEAVGTFYFLARAVDNTMLVALSSLASQQTKGTAQTMDKLVHLLDYAATHPNPSVRFHRSDMVLYCHSDASYLSEPQARSRVGGFFYLGNTNEPAENPSPNGPIHVESRILKNVMTAASEAEIAAIFHNGQETVYIRQILTEIGFPQPSPTRITTDNSTADAFANKRLKIKRSKALDMRYYWIQERTDLAIHWASGKSNHGDYYTKHHPPSHHIRVRPTYMYTGNYACSLVHQQELQPYYSRCSCEKCS